MKNEEIGPMEVKRALEDVPSIFTFAERLVLKQMYGLEGEAPVSLAEAAKALRVTKARLRQVREKAIAKVGSALRDRQPMVVPPGDLRDWFAGLAMQGYVTSYSPHKACDEVEADGDEIADMAYILADAMMARRSGTVTPRSAKSES